MSRRECSDVPIAQKPVGVVLVALGSKADMRPPPADVRFGSRADIGSILSSTDTLLRLLLELRVVIVASAFYEAKIRLLKEEASAGYGRVIRRPERKAN